MQEHEEDVGRALAQWLQEAARRAHRPAVHAAAVVATADVRPPAGRRGLWERIRWPLLLGITAIAFLQFFFASTEVEILRLPKVLVFVMVDGHLPSP